MNASPEAGPGGAEEGRLEAQIAGEMGAPRGGSAAPEVQVAAGGAPQTGGNPLARTMLLPDIAAIGSFSMTYDSYDAATLSPRSGPVSDAHKVTPSFEELELSLQSVIDPYGRADVFIAFEPDGVSVEEAYLTTLALPAGFQLKAGTFKSPFGRLNQQHPHAWDFADAPLAMTRLVADEALSGPGADLAWLAPVPWFVELHLAGQTTTPAGEETERRTVTGRVQQFFDLGSSTALGVGVAGSRIEGGGEVAARDLGELDLYAKIRSATSRSYVALQGELFARRVDGGPVGQDDLGGYAQAIWRQDDHWGWGLRYENAPAFDSGREHRASALAIWMPSEFTRIRMQVAGDRRPGGQDGLEAILHLEFIIGSHGAHPF